eukprot:s60_g60.t3
MHVLRSLRARNFSCSLRWVGIGRLPSLVSPQRITMQRHFASQGGAHGDKVASVQLQEIHNRMQRKKGHAQKDRDLAKPWDGKQGLPSRVPYRFRLSEQQEDQNKANLTSGKKDRDKQADQGPSRKTAPPVYSDHAGLRFPTLDTAENYDYNRDRGFDRIVERAFPIKVPGYRGLDPYFREYIWFLNNLDPARFTISRIAKRYRLREKTVAKVVQEWATNQYLTRSGLTRLRDKQQTREAVVLAKKEQAYAKWVGWDQLGDEDDPESDDEALGESKGWRSTSDWVRRQTVEVEMMSAFPMMEKRDPMPKRVDVDMVVDSRRGHKIINWIDPTDKSSLHALQMVEMLTVPPKAYGALPSASSQMSLWGDDDFNYRTKTIWDGRWKRHRKRPLTYKKDIHSDALNTTIYNLRVTPSALYNMDDAGGFDNYILRTPPQELRSATGEKMREVMYFYMKNPEDTDFSL